MNTKENQNEHSKPYIITNHALERFKERNPNKPSKDKDLNPIIQRLLKDSFEIKFSAAHMVIRLLNNHIQAAKYMYNNGWIFVCSHDNIIITIERQDDKKFGKDLFKVDQQEKNDVSKNHSAGSGL
jgi:hypothetical protein